MRSYHRQERGEMGTGKARGQEGRLEEPREGSKKGQGRRREGAPGLGGDGKPVVFFRAGLEDSRVWPGAKRADRRGWGKAGAGRIG